MVEQFLNHIHRHKLCKATDKILLAVSGGLDSMVMFHLFRQAGFNFAVAHCNFQLRGEDSKSDEALVNQACVQHGIPFHVKRFDTTCHAEEKGISIQMAARELRYNFFNQLKNDFGYDTIATAHHLNDSIETVLLNLVRGTGIEGITGIPVKNENIIRPLLFASRKMIEDYAALMRLSWREDLSNASDDYHRNFIRHQVIPKLQEINSSLEHTFADTVERLSDSSKIVKSFIENFKKEAVDESEDSIRINISKLKNQSEPKVILWEMIKHLGFNYAQCKDILEVKQPGKIFLAEGYLLTIDREFIIIQKERQVLFTDVKIHADTEHVSSRKAQLKISNLSINNFVIRKDASVAQLDADKLSFPLSWRSWKPGDSFIPLGMNNPKKLSDFLIDNKIPLSEKSEVTVLESNHEVVWVVGMRINEKFKITKDTKRIMLIEVTFR